MCLLNQTYNKHKPRTQSDATNGAPVLHVLTILSNERNPGADPEAKEAEQSSRQQRAAANRVFRSCGHLIVTVVAPERARRRAARLCCHHLLRHYHHLGSYGHWRFHLQKLILSIGFPAISMSSELKSEDKGNVPSKTGNYCKNMGIL